MIHTFIASLYSELEIISRQSVHSLKPYRYVSVVHQQRITLLIDDVLPKYSMRALRREREVLSKQMLKRFSAEERENVYRKWGIGLDTKQRRLQLARCLWTETRDMDHVRESANIVARLIGFKEPGQAAKEMFSLSFTPQAASRRSFGWKNSMSSLL